jgi:hypothetical protein
MKKDTYRKGRQVKWTNQKEGVGEICEEEYLLTESKLLCIRRLVRR